MSAGRVEPRVTWPRSVVPGEPFLVSVDLALVGSAPESWPFEGEEVEFTCVLDGARHFRVEAVDDASVVLHRFGGSYGAARFVVTARPAPGRRALRLTPLTSHGIVMGSVEIPVEVNADAAVPGSSEPSATVDVAAPAPPPRRTALCIELGAYDDLSPLPGAYEAARRVTRAFSALGYECTLLTDPTEEQLRTETARFLAGADPGLRVVYFSGHGLLHQGELVLAARDTRRQNPSSTLAFRHLTADMKDAAPTLFLLDTCKSGRAAALATHGHRPPAYVVASCGATENAHAELFSNSLADVLEQAADGRLAPGTPGTAVPLSTLVEAVDRRMREVMPHVRQTVTSSLTVPRSPDPAFIPVVAAPQPPASPSLRVLGVHGFGSQQTSPLFLAEQWLPAVRDGIHRVDPSADVSAVDLTVAYFADLLRQPRFLGTEVPGDGDRDEDGDEDGDEVTAADAEAVAEWIAEVEGAQPGQRPRVRAAVQRAAGLLAGNMPTGATEHMMMMSLRELSRYFAHELRSEVTARIQRAVEETRPHVLLAHSLGSVAAYEALWQRPYPELDTLVTTGSPLGLKPVVKRLAPHGHRRPPGVRRWFNLVGTGDVVAIPVDGVPKHFEGVTHQVIDVGAVNPHAVTSYLRSPPVGVILADLLRRHGAPS